MVTSIHFTECEHEGDLDMYIGDLRRSGATIVSSDINFDAETGEVYIEIDEDKMDAFVKAFKETDSFDFSNLY